MKRPRKQVTVLPEPAPPSKTACYVTIDGHRYRVDINTRVTEEDAEAPAQTPKLGNLIQFRARQKP